MSTALLHGTALDASLQAYLSRASGKSFREIRMVGSTALRQCAKVEEVMDKNPLVEAVVTRAANDGGNLPSNLTSAKLHEELNRTILRRLCEPQAKLLISSLRSRIVRDDGEGPVKPLADVSTTQCEAMALLGWIEVGMIGRKLQVYVATPLARQALRKAQGTLRGASLVGVEAIQRQAPDFLSPTDLHTAREIRDMWTYAPERERAERLIRTLDKGYQDVVILLCCKGMGVQLVENRLGWPPRSAKVVLKLGLQALAETLTSVEA